MGRAPCCDKANVKKGPWSPEEDAKLKEFIEKFGTQGNWIALPQKAGLKRCGKSCRLRWLNYLRPNIKHGEFSDEEDRIICTLYASIGSRWSIIAAQLPGRTDNDIKNYWNTKLKKKLMGMIPSIQHKFQTPFSSLIHQSPLISQSQPLSLFYNSPLYSQPNIKSSLLSTPINNQNFLNCSLPLPTSSQYNYSSYNFNPNQQENNNLMDFQYYPLRDNNNSISNMLMFGGGNEASCSSSDGSYGKDHHPNHVIKQEEMGCQFHHQGYNGNISNIGFEDQNQKFMLHYSDGKMMNPTCDPLMSSAVFVDDEKPNHGNINVENSSSQLEYDLQEVKQLISSSNNNVNINNIISSSNSSSFLFNDDNKTDEERGIYYYNF